MSFRYAAGINKPGYNGLLVPDAPTIGTATAGNATASVPFTAPSNIGGSAITGYTVTSSPGSITATGTTSPISVTGLTNNTAYTFTVTATNIYGTSISSSASNSVTPALVAQLWSWGQNNKGQLGLGNTTQTSSPQQIGALTNWLQTAAGQNWALAVKQDGTLWAWGNNSEGQLGQGNTAYRSSPVQIGSGTTWAYAAAGFTNCFAVKTDGTIWSWGYGDFGSLGRGVSSQFASSPVQIGGLTNWLYVAAGYGGVGAIKTDGTLWTWGRGQDGITGQGNTTNLSSPKQVGSLTNWSKISNGKYNMFAVKTDGTMWAWGSNDQGALGVNSATATFSSPVQIGTLTTWVSVAAGLGMGAAIKSDNTLWGWGDGALGRNGIIGGADYSSPKLLKSTVNWSSVSENNANGLAISTTGNLYSWGSSSNGQLGYGTADPYSNIGSPKQVGALATWLSVSAGAYFSTATKSA